MKWFRFYHDALDDPKVQRLPGETFKFWVNLLCLASQGAERGLIAKSVEEIAFALRVSDDDGAAMMADLIRRGLIEETTDGYGPHNWNGRQFKSDNVADRVHEHRERKKSIPETLPVTLQATDDATLHPSVSTDLQITDTQRDIPPLPPMDDAADAARLTPPVDKPPPKPSKPRTPKQQAADAQYARRVALFEGWCRGVGLDPDSEEAHVGRDVAFRHLKPIINSQVPTPEDFEACTRYMASQSWRDDPPAIPTVIKNFGGWVAKGRPETPAPANVTFVGGRPSGADISRASINELRSEMGLAPRPTDDDVIDATFRRTS